MEKPVSVLVLGSINMDLVVSVPHLPRPGETLTGTQFNTVPGGKGANQAVACARLGAHTRLVGRLGKDAFGEMLSANLAREGVDVSGVKIDPSQSSGVALITLDAQGENTIVVVPGANGTIGEAELAEVRSILPGVRVLLLQLEVPMETVIQAARIAREHGILVILDPAPVLPLPAELFSLVDVLTPNETEAAALCGFTLNDDEDAERAARDLRARGIRQVIIKRGSHGVTVYDGSGLAHYPAFHVVAVDTVGAGDAFNGALAVALAEGLPFAQAVRWGLAAGALAVTRSGAQSGMPTRAELEDLMQKQAPSR